MVPRLLCFSRCGYKGQNCRGSDWSALVSSLMVLKIRLIITEYPRKWEQQYLLHTLLSHGRQDWLLSSAFWLARRKCFDCCEWLPVTQRLASNLVISCNTQMSLSLGIIICQWPVGTKNELAIWLLKGTVDLIVYPTGSKRWFGRELV